MPEDEDEDPQREAWKPTDREEPSTEALVGVGCVIIFLAFAAAWVLGMIQAISSSGH